MLVSAVAKEPILVPAGGGTMDIRHVFVRSRRDCSNLSYAAVVYE